MLGPGVLLGEDVGLAGNVSLTVGASVGAATVGLLIAVLVACGAAVAASIGVSLAQPASRPATASIPAIHAIFGRPTWMMARLTVTLKRVNSITD